jgi:hypothetical protein
VPILPPDPADADLALDHLENLALPGRVPTVSDSTTIRSPTLPDTAPYVCPSAGGVATQSSRGVGGPGAMDAQSPSRRPTNAPGAPTAPRLGAPGAPPLYSRLITSVKMSVCPRGGPGEFRPSVHTGYRKGRPTAIPL